jgi:hypothetical protein
MGWLNRAWQKPKPKKRPSATMAKITREMLHGYLEDALSDGDTAQVEKELRESEALRRLLRVVIQDRDRGEHSIGAIWRRQRLSCPGREQLGSYLLQVLEPGLQDYIDFHLRTIACPYCLANLADLQVLQREPAPKAQARRRRFFESSAGYLHVAKDR